MLASFIKQLRQQTGLSIGSWSRKSGIARTTLWRWERGDTLPRDEELNAALNVLMVSHCERKKAMDMLQRKRVIQKLDLPQPPGTTAINRGELLRALRLRSGWSQQETAERLGVNRVTLANWERGDHWMDAAMLHRFCLLCQATPTELTALTALPEPKTQDRLSDSIHVTWDDIETFDGNFAEMELRYLTARAKLARTQHDPDGQYEMRCTLDYLHYLILQGRLREVRRESHRIATHRALGTSAKLYARHKVLLAVAQQDSPSGYKKADQVLGELLAMGESIPVEERCRAKAEWAQRKAEKDERDTALRLSASAIHDARISGDENLAAIAKRARTIVQIDLGNLSAAARDLEQFPVHTPLFKVQKIFTQGVFLQKAGSMREAATVYSDAARAAHIAGMSKYVDRFRNLAQSLSG